MVTTQGMLVELLDLERIEVDIFRGRSLDEDLQGLRPRGELLETGAGSGAMPPSSWPPTQTCA
jgi:hypothetical protein